MMLSDGKGIPLSFTLHSASPHESKLAKETLESLPLKLRGYMERLVADNAYDSLALREDVADMGHELISRLKRATRRPESKMAARSDGIAGAGKSSAASPGFTTSGAWWFAGTATRTSSPHLSELLASQSF
jgi:transposase